MSAPKTRDPLAVTTSDGMAWVRRAVTRGGRGLYAPEEVKGCPEFVMATLEELAEHGIQGREAAAEPSECERLRARVAELEAEQGNNDGAKAPWGRAEDGRPYLPEGAHWTDVPELVDRTVAGIQARVDQAQPGHWYAAPATETGLAPGTVRTRVDGYPRTVGQFTNVLPADLELILHAHGDLGWCLEMLAKFRARVAELEAERHSTNAALVDVTVALRAAESGRAPEADAPSQVLPLVVDVPVPVVLTESDGPVMANNASARASAARLRKLLHPLDKGVRS
ncbi:hypothetical protein ACFV1F_17130 [Streptomyces sp. NPDC059590]|uniref:hypothetical protein n=1 Tax=Streptomyces sp. NPDC059590 TaxID=3346877 RepID=UPI003686A0D0